MYKVCLVTADSGQDGTKLFPNFPDLIGHRYESLDSFVLLFNPIFLSKGKHFEQTRLSFFKVCKTNQCWQNAVFCFEVLCSCAWKEVREEQY